MVANMHSQINRAVSLAISDGVIRETKNIMSSMSSSEHRDTEASSSPNSQENRENNIGLKTKITKKDSRSAGDLRNTITIEFLIISAIYYFSRNIIETSR